MYELQVRFQYFALWFGFGSVVWKTVVSVSFFCFVLFSALSVQWMASHVLTHFNDDYACVTLLMLIHSLNYTFNSETRHSHDDEINCNCVWQCFINIYCLSNRPKKHTFFRASVLFKCYDFNSRVWAFPFVKFSDDARNHWIDNISHKLTFHTDIYT